MTPPNLSGGRPTDVSKVDSYDYEEYNYFEVDVDVNSVVSSGAQSGVTSVSSTPSLGGFEPSGPSRDFGDLQDHTIDTVSREVGEHVVDATEYGSVEKFMASRVENGLECQSFVACNMKKIISQCQLWKRELPMVKPFYAVKCRPDPAILRLMVSMGCGFDCATQGEMNLVLNCLGEKHNLSAQGQSQVAQSIVYANPAKMEHMIQFAMDSGVRMTVFDGPDELLKIASLGGHEKMDLLLRLSTDDSASVCQFSKKFGCPVNEAPPLLELARKLGLHVAGVSFHVGSGCGDANAYLIALEHTARVFKAAEELNMPRMTIVDIGGGFPGEDAGVYSGHNLPTFQELAATIRVGLNDMASDLGRPLSSFRCIAEPGRYFVSSACTVATKVYSRKGGVTGKQALYVDDGVYGTFNNIVYDHATPMPKKLALLRGSDEDKNLIMRDADAASTPSVAYLNRGICNDRAELKLSEVVTAMNGAVTDEKLPTSVFGPTCDGLDQLANMEVTNLPRCEVGDWLFWEDMGAYTHTASFVFNGYTHVPNTWYCYY